MKIFGTIETEIINADLSKVVDRIIKQYEIFPNAFQKETIQNSWDARLDRKEGKDWEIKIYTYNEDKQTHLIVEDFGTKGMDERRWDAFLSLWKPEKGRLDVGGQGQGKFVIMKASRNHILIVESISAENSYKCKYLQDERKSKDNQNYSIENFIQSAQSLSHKGTKIWVYNAEEKFLNVINSEEFIESIIESWWQILGNRFKAKISLFNKEINLPHLPYLPFPKEELILLKNERLGNFGRIKRLVLTFHEVPISKIFQGVRVQRANMMITKIPFEVYEKEYQNRFSGYIEFDDDLELLLKDIERTDHSGFLYESPWKEIKNLVRDEANKFVDKIIPKKREGRTLHLKNLKEIIQKANQIISDNCPDVLGSSTVVPPLTRKPKPPLRIGYLTINKKEVKYGDIVKPLCTIINETEKEKKILLKVELKRKGDKIDKEEYNFRINGKKRKPIKLSSIELKKEKYSEGKYTLRATIEENRHDVDTKATSFYLEVKREPVKRGFVKTAEFIEIDEPIRNEPISKGVVKINLAHKDFMNILHSFSQKKRQQNEQIGFYIIKICLDEAINELFRLKLKDKDSNIDLDDLLKEITQLRDKMYYETYI